MPVDDQRALAVQIRLQETIARRSAVLINRELKRVAREAGKGYAEGDKMGAMEVLPSHAANMKTIIDRTYTRSISTFFEVSVERLEDGRKSRGLPGLERKDAEGELLESIRRWTTEVSAIKVAEITNTTRELINDAIASSVGTDLTTAQVAKQINKILGGTSRSRSITIARTETHASAMYGSERGARSTGLQLVKEWVPAEDSRTRPGHASMLDTQVGIDERFTVPESRPGAGDATSMSRPGDPTAPAGQVINCRCALVYQEIF